MATLRDLADKVKQLFSSAASNPIVNPGGVLGNAIGRGQSFSPTANNGNNFWSTPPAQTLANVQNRFQTGNIIPQVQPFKSSGIVGGIVGGLGNAVANLPGGIVNSVYGKGITQPTADITNLFKNTLQGKPLVPYDQLFSPQARLGYNIGSQFNKSSGQNLGVKNNPKQVIGNIAGTIDPLLNAFVPSGAKNLAQNVSKETLKQAIKSGSQAGITYGGIMGLVSSLSENRDTKNNLEYLKNVLTSTAGGAAVGLALGAGTGAVSNIVGSVFEHFQKLNPDLPKQQITEKTKNFFKNGIWRNEKGQFAAKEPQFYGELSKTSSKANDVRFTQESEYKLIREGLGLPKDGIPKPGSNRDAFARLDLGLSKDTVPQTEAKANTLKPGEVLNPQQSLEARPMSPGSVDSSLGPIIPPEKGQLNISKLNVEGEGKQLLQANEAQVKPTIIGNKEVVKAAELSTGRKNPITDEQMKSMMAQQLKNRQMVTDLTQKFNQAKSSGASEQELAKIMLEIADQSKTARQGGTFAGRLLQAQNIIADQSASPMQRIFALMDNAGVDQAKYIKEAVNVNFDNPAEVVGFYRKFVPPSLSDVLTEIRYTNMLSSPLTHIVNTASNSLMTGVVAPIEKTITGALDFGKTALTGKERQYYVSSGLDYGTGYLKSIPEAFSKAYKVMSGKDVLLPKDMEYIPTSVGGPLKAYTTPLRALEAADQFFKTLVQGGVTNELKNAPQKLSMESIASKASNEAEYRLFRQSFDPNGELGQGYVLKTWDKWNSAINGLRRLPGGKWIVPFLQTPTNILKQGFEYSPFGVTTIPGAKTPIEQLSKAIIGSTVFAGAYQIGKAGLMTWSVPSNAKEKALFYAAGMQPYSIKIGDKWVSFSKLGPISYPIAMAAALTNAEKYNPDQSQIKNISSAMGSILAFFGDQSYMKSIGDVMDAVRGGGSVGKNAITGEVANIINQLIPYKSFLGWVDHMVDPVYRKATTLPDMIKNGVPGLSQTIQPYTDISGNPSARSNPFLNAVSPAQISQENPANVPLYNMYSDSRIQSGVQKRIEDQIKASLDSGDTSSAPGGTQPLDFGSGHSGYKAGNKIMYKDDNGDIKTITAKDGDVQYWDSSSGTVKSVNLSPIQPPKTTGLTELDKKIVSKYNSELTTQATAVANLWQAGRINQDEAEQMLTRLKNMKIWTKKSKKFSAPKVNIKPLKIKTSSVKKYKLSKAPTFKLSGKTKLPKLSIGKLPKYKGVKINLTKKLKPSNIG